MLLNQHCKLLTIIFKGAKKESTIESRTPEAKSKASDTATTLQEHAHRRPISREKEH